MKRMMLICLCAAMVLSLVGCGQPAPQEQPTAATTAAPTTSTTTVPTTTTTAPTTVASTQQSQYDEALAALEAGEHQKAYDLFVALGDYKDSSTYVEQFVLVLVKEELTTSLNNRKTSWRYRYDERGNHIQTQLFVYNTLNETVDFVYDEKGNHLKTIHYDADGNLLTYEECIYDADGRLSQKNKDQYQLSMVAYQFVTTYTYDEQGRLVKEEEQERLGYRSSTEYYYDDGDQCVKEIYVDSNGAQRTVCHRYDENGRLVEESDGDGQVTVIYTYDEHGWCVNETHNPSQTTQFTVDYMYDEHGNRIEKVETKNGDTYTVRGIYEQRYQPID